MNYATSTLIVEFEPQVTSLDAITGRVKDFGYDIEGPRAEDPAKSAIIRNARLAATVISGVLLAAGGMVWLLAGASAAVSTLFILAAVIGGIFPARTAALSLRGLVLDTNLLVTVAALGAIALHEYA